MHKGLAQSYTDKGTALQGTTADTPAHYFPQKKHKRRFISAQLSTNIDRDLSAEGDGAAEAACGAPRPINRR